MTRTRATGFRSTVSKTGDFRATIGTELNERLNEYCNAKRMNKSVYVNLCVARCVEQDLEQLKRERFQIYSKDELIEMLLREREQIWQG